MNEDFIKAAGNAALTMMKIGTMAQKISAIACGRSPAARRKVAIEWIMTANTAAATNPHTHRIGVASIVNAPG